MPLPLVVAPAAAVVPVTAGVVVVSTAVVLAGAAGGAGLVIGGLSVAMHGGGGPLALRPPAPPAMPPPPPFNTKWSDWYDDDNPRKFEVEVDREEFERSMKRWVAWLRERLNDPAHEASFTAWRTHGLEYGPLALPHANITTLFFDGEYFVGELHDDHPDDENRYNVYCRPYGAGAVEY